MKIKQIIKGEKPKYIYDFNLNMRILQENEELTNLKLLLLQGDYILELEDSENFYYYSSLSAKFDIFYNNKNEIFFEFNEVVKNMKNLTIDIQAKKYFIEHRYYRENETLFNEIRRVRVGELLIKNKENNKLKIKNILKEENIKIAPTYENFKKLLKESIKNNLGKNNVILQSSGKDSNLILSILRKELNLENVESMNLSIKNPKLNINIEDSCKSQKISEILGVAYTQKEIDFFKLKIEDINQIILKNPLASHLSLNFKNLLDGKVEYNILCGQNADSLYNLGPTEQMISSVLKRYFLSDLFISSLEDVEGKYKIIKKFISIIIKKIFEIKHKKKLYIPQDSYEYLESFKNFKNYLILMEKEIMLKNKEMGLKTIKEIREKMFDMKLNSFFRGGDSRAVYYSSDNTGEIKLVYSTNIMILFFRNLNYSMGIKDIFIGKYYIQKYLKELFKEYFSLKVYKVKEKGVLTLKKWEDTIVEIPIFKEMRNKINNRMANNNLTEMLGEYWIEYILTNYKENLKEGK